MNAAVRPTGPTEERIDASLADGPDMRGIVIRIGRHWNERLTRWALERMAHRGRPNVLLSEKRISLYSFQEQICHSTGTDLQAWSWGFGKKLHEHAVFLAERGPLDEESRREFSNGLLVIWRSRIARVEVYRGLECGTPVFFARHGRSLLMAPERKAFSDLPSPRRIRRLNRGGMLRFQSRDGTLTASKIRWKWTPVPSTPLDFEACCKRIEGLLESAIGDLHPSNAKPLAVTMSGGLDSAIAACLAVRAGFRCEAFTVGFDSGQNGGPSDIVGARKTAASMGIPLHELLIRPGEAERLARDSVFLLESSHWREVEMGSMVIRLVEELRKRNYDRVLTGIGADGNFAGNVSGNDLGESFHEWMAENRRGLSVMEYLSAVLGIDLLTPFRTTELDSFCLSLPQDCLVEVTDGQVFGKRALRTLYRSRLPPSLVSTPKAYVYDSTGGDRFYERLWGSPAERQKRYASWLKEHLAVPRLRWKLRRPDPQGLTPSPIPPGATTWQPVTDE